MAQRMSRAAKDWFNAQADEMRVSRKDFAETLTGEDIRKIESLLARKRALRSAKRLSRSTLALIKAKSK